jgi:hypothetical protein
LKLLSCTGFEALQIEGTHGNSYHALAKPGGVAKQLSTTITKLVVNWPGIGRHERWAELLERLPALQHLVLETNGDPNGWNGIPDGLRVGTGPAGCVGDGHDTQSSQDYRWSCIETNPPCDDAERHIHDICWVDV